MKTQLPKTKIRFHILILLCLTVIGLSGCENKDIEAEKKRMETIENQIIESITHKDLQKAKLLCIKLKWQYQAKTVGNTAKCDELKEYWENKRKEYLKSIGEDPEKLLEKDTKKGIKQEWKEFIKGKTN